MALGPSHAHSRSAGTASERPFQVVVVDPAALAGPVVQRRHLLDALEELTGDDRLVLALVLHAPVGDLADVVAVVEHAGEAREVHGPGQAAPCRPLQ